MKLVTASLVFGLIASTVVGAPDAPVHQAAAPGGFDEWNKRAAPVDQAAAPGGYDEWNKRASPVDQAAAPGGFDEWNKRSVTRN